MQNTFELEGIVRKVEKFVSKAGKEIITLIVDVDGQYPQTIPVKCFGRLAGQSSGWKPGATLEITGRLGGRMWQDKCYPDVIADSVEVKQSGKQEDLPGAVPKEEADDTSSVPF
jgi:single-stranded DNA-binding protein